MFVSHELILDVSFVEAQARLVNLTHGGWLSTASQGAYADGLVGMIRVGPLGDVLGASKLVRVGLPEPVPKEDVVVVPLRWEATAVIGRPFSVLHSVLIMTAERPGDAVLTLKA